MRPLSHRSLLAFAGILVVAAALRLHGLDAESAWLDEAFAVGTARSGLSNLLYETRLDVHPPLYYFLLYAWITVAGPTVWAARLLSVLFSLGILVATAAVGTRLIGRSAGLAAAALLAVSVFHIEFAQEARMYTLLTMLATFSTYAFIRLFEPLRVQWFALYAVTSALMVQTHVYALFIIGAQGLTVLADVLWRRGASGHVWMRWLGAQLLAFLAFLPWLPVFTWQVSLVQTSFWIAEPEPNAWISAFRTYAGSSAPLLGTLLVLVAIGVFSLARRRPTSSLARPPLFFLVPWLLGPIVFPFVLSFVGSPIFLPKYTIAASVPFTLLAAAGIVALPLRVVQMAALAICLVLSLRTLPDYYRVQTKDGWRDAVAAIDARAPAGDLVIVYPYFNTYAYDFYHWREDVTVRPFPMYSSPPPDDGWPVTIERATTGFDGFWFVALQADPTASVALEQLREHFTETSHEIVQKIAIYRFERAP